MPRKCVKVAGSVFVPNLRTFSLNFPISTCIAGQRLAIDARLQASEVVAEPAIPTTPGMEEGILEALGVQGQRKCGMNICKITTIDLKILFLANIPG